MSSSNPPPPRSGQGKLQTLSPRRPDGHSHAAACMRHQQGSLIPRWAANQFCAHSSWGDTECRAGFKKPSISSQMAAEAMLFHKLISPAATSPYLAEGWKIYTGPCAQRETKHSQYHPCLPSCRGGGYILFPFLGRVSWLNGVGPPEACPAT